MIRIENLSKSYSIVNKAIPVLKNLNFKVDKGDFIALTGKSGSGKSTLLNIMGMLDNYDQGDYYLNDQLIKNISEKDAAIYRNKYIGFVFQSFNLLPFKSALDNVSLALYYGNVISRKERNDRAVEMLDKVGLSERIHHLPTELSGGQKQRVAIARALITNADLILADEPTGALDTSTSEEIMDLLKKINEEGKTIILVTHEKEIANQCKKIIEIKDGEII